MSLLGLSYKLDDDASRLLCVTRPMHNAAGTGAVLLELLEVGGEVRHGVFADRTPGLTQLLPFGQFAHDACALGLDYVRCMANILAQLRVFERGARGHRKGRCRCWVEPAIHCVS